MNSRLKIYLDGSGETWMYELYDALGNTIVSGDGYISPEIIYQELCITSIALSSALSNVIVIE